MAISKLTVGGVEIPSVKSVTYHEAVNGGVDLRPGCVGSAYIEAEVYGTQADAVSPGAAVSYYIVDADSTETLIGVFTAEPVVKTKNTYRLVAYDNAYKLNVYFSGWLRDHQSDFPMTRAALVAAACTVAGVTNATPNWTGSVQTVEAFYADGLTCRDILSYAAELSGYFVRCHADGQLYFEWYTSAPGTRIYPSSGEEQSETRYAYKQDGLQYANYTVPAIDGVAVHPSGEDDVAYIYPASPSGDNLLHIRNNLLLMGATAAVYNAAAQMIYNQMTSVGAYVPATAQMFISECPYESGETVLVTDIQGVSFKTLVMSKTVTASGVTLESTGNEAQDPGFENTQKALTQLASDVVQINKLKVSYADIDQAIINYLTANDITAQNLTIVDENGNVLATYNADGITLGQTDEAHAELDFNSFVLLDKNGNPYVLLGDMRDQSGLATITDEFVGNGTSRVFTVNFALSEIVSVTVNGEPTSDYTISGKNVVFNSAPSDGDEIVVVYETTGNVYRYDIGVRASNSRIGAYSVSEGLRTVASGNYSHSEGGGTTASGVGSHSEGDGTTASGSVSHAEGQGSTASGVNSHAEGSATVASGQVSHAEGGLTTASGGHAHAEGSRTTASGNCSHSEGYLTEASADYSHAEGRSTVASGYYSHAEGDGTTASGSWSHAEGEQTTASGFGSHAQGWGTIANHLAQTALGEYNAADPSTQSSGVRGNYIEIVGNGTSDTARSNARTIDWNGNEWLAGYLTAQYFRKDMGSLANDTNYTGTAFYDASGLRGYLAFRRSATGGEGMRLTAQRTVNGSTVANTLILYIDSSGNRSVVVSDADAWHKGLGYAVGDTITGATTDFGYAQLTGIWISTTNLRFTIPTRKSCAGLSATASGEFYCRGGGNAASVTIDNTMTVTCTCNEVGVTVNIVYASAPTYAAYRQAVAVQLQPTFTISFS